MTEYQWMQCLDLCRSHRWIRPACSMWTVSEVHRASWPTTAGADLRNALALGGTGYSVHIQNLEHNATKTVIGLLQLPSLKGLT